VNAKGFLRFASFALVPALFAALLAIAAQPALGSQARSTNAPLGSDGLVRVPPLARVTDPDHYLSAADKAGLEAKLAGFETSRGSQLAVIILTTTMGEPLEDFAHRVGDAWKIGRKGIGDGVLITVAVQDHATRIDVARSLEGAIPDLAASRIIRERMAPHFLVKDYAGGISSGLDGLFALITAEALPPGAGNADANPMVQRDQRGRVGGEDRLRMVIPFLFIGAFLGNALRRGLGAPGAVVVAGGTGLIASLVFASALTGVIVGFLVFLLSLFGAPMFLATQVLGGRGPGIGMGSGGFRSGGGGDFSGGGASGRW
jgi:uncharacterized protein